MVYLAECDAPPSCRNDKEKHDQSMGKPAKIRMVS